MLQCCSAAYHVTHSKVNTDTAGGSKQRKLYLGQSDNRGNKLQQSQMFNKSHSIPFVTCSLWSRFTICVVGAVLGQGIRLTFATIRVGITMIIPTLFVFVSIVLITLSKVRRFHRSKISCTHFLQKMNKPPFLILPQEVQGQN